MDMILKVAKSCRTQYDEDWVYFSGFDTIETSTYWFVYLVEAAEKVDEGAIGCGPRFGLRCKRPNEPTFERKYCAVESFVDRHSLNLLAEDETKLIPVKLIQLLNRNQEHKGAYEHVTDIVLNTRAFLLGANGQTIDRI